MAESNEPHFRKQAEELFELLKSFGCHRFMIANLDCLQFDVKPSPKPRAADVAMFARAVRKLTNLERSGVVVADIDKMGKVIGWHLKAKG